MNDILWRRIGGVSLILFISIPVFVNFHMLPFIAALFDNILGGLIFLPPYISWAIIGFITGTLLYFAFIEADKLSRPKARRILIGITCLFLISAFLVGQLGFATIRQEKRMISIKKNIPAFDAGYSADYRDYWETGKDFFYKKEYEKALHLFKIVQQKKNFLELENFIKGTEKKLKTLQLKDYLEKNRKDKNFDGMFSNLVDLKKLAGKGFIKFDLLEEISMVDERGQKEIVLGGIPFVYIKPGTFQMGCFNSNERFVLFDAVPVHEVELEGFWISRTEITEKQFNKGYSNLPVCSVDWSEAINFAKKFGEKYDLKADLPTEAQWEFAARNRGQEIVYPWGNEIDKTKANYRDTGGGIMPVRTFSPNPLGIFDISGNLREWCRDYYSKTFYSIKKTKVKDPLNSNPNEEVVVRGGCYADGKLALKTYVRYSRSKDSADQFTGFRIVLEK